MTDDVLDPITGLYRTHEPPWLIEMPPDTVQHGMRVGDTLLAEMARRVRTAADPWPAYRVGGDEFLVIARLPDDHAVASSQQRSARRWSSRTRSGCLGPWTSCRDAP